MTGSARIARRGFSLLEVMVAVGILGLALTVILSAQGGLIASNRSTAHMGISTTLARCKMTELEEKMLRLGYPEIDSIDTDQSCCEEADVAGFTCDTRVERVILPNPPSTNTDGGADAGELNLDLTDGGAFGGPPIINNVAGGPGLNLDVEGGVQNFSSIEQKVMGGQGPVGLLNMAFGMVYPILKPMMEASIRRLTVKVKWKEGPHDKDFTLVQFITNPALGGFALDGGTGEGGAPHP